jgi:hypothetical protein
MVAARLRNIRIFAFAACVASSTSACARPDDGDFALWQLREERKEYVLCAPDGESSGALRARVDEYMQSAGYRPKRLESAATHAESVPRGTTLVVLDVLRDAGGPCRVIGAPEEVRRALHGESSRAGAVSMFTSVAGRPVLALIGKNEEYLAAAVSRAGRPGGAALFPDRPATTLLHFGENQVELAPHGEGGRNLGPCYYFERGEPMSAESLAAVQAEADAAFILFHRLFGRFEIPPIHIIIYQTLEEKWRATGDARMASSCVAERRVDCVAPLEFRSAFRRELARVVAFGRLGLAGCAAMEDGVMEYCADPAVEARAARILSTGIVSFPDLFEPATRTTRSPESLRALDGGIVAGLAALAEQTGAAAELPARMTAWYRGGSLERTVIDAAAKALAAKESRTPGGTPPRIQQFEAGRALPVRGFIVLDGGGPPGPDMAFRGTLQQIRDAGGNGVLLSVVRRPGQRAGSFTNPESGDDAQVEWQAAEIRRAGMIPMVRSLWWGQRNGQWIGEPGALPPGDWQDLWEDARQVLLHDALLAERIGCEWFFFGTELRGLTRDAEQAAIWSQLIQQIRKVYSGGLSYAASWDITAVAPTPGEPPGPRPSEFETIPFWKQLDALSVTGYMPLGTQPLASDEVLVGVASSFADRIGRVAQATGLPVLLAEVGYPAGRAAHVAPWRSSGPPNAEAQRRCYGAFAQAFRERAWLRGLIINGWERDGERVGARNAAFNMAHQASRGILTDFFSQYLSK